MDRALEQLVWRRADGRCEYCKLSQEDIELRFQTDHVIAKKHFGASKASNLCLSCFACNNNKGSNISGIDSASGRIVPLFNPRRHKWTKHFRWNGPLLIGLTPAGRATVSVLKINLDYRVDLRSVLIAANRFHAE